MNLLLYMAPIAVVLLIPATLIMERGADGETVWEITAEKAKEDVMILPLLAVNSAMAYFVNLTNFLVTKHTSPLTLQVCYRTVQCRPPFVLCFAVLHFFFLRKHSSVRCVLP